jgi:hypothetical protein
MTNRKPPVDDPAENAPLPRPAWIADTVDRARAMGLTPAQREAIAWLLATAELDDAPLPRITARPTRIASTGTGTRRPAIGPDGGSSPATGRRPRSCLRGRQG